MWRKVQNKVLFTSNRSRTVVCVHVYCLLLSRFPFFLHTQIHKRRMLCMYKYMRHDYRSTKSPNSPRNLLLTIFSVLRGRVYLYECVCERVLLVVFIYFILLKNGIFNSHS